MKKMFAVLLVAAFLWLSCSKSEGTITLRYWAFGGSGDMNGWLRDRTEQFMQLHPNVRVEVSLKSWNMIRELLYTNFVCGTGPDVMRVHANYAAEFGENGFFYPIDQFPDFAEVKSWYEPYAIDATCYKGHYYGLPNSAIAFVLSCNRDLFDRYGLQPPRTWSEFRRVAKELTRDTDGDGEVDQWGLVIMGGDRGGFAYRLAPFIFKAGADFLSDDLTEVLFDSEAAFSALQLFVDMHQIDGSITPGFLAYTHSEINDLFSNNKVGMSIEGPWFRWLVGVKSPGKDLYTVAIPVPDHLLAQADSLPTLQDMVMEAINMDSKHLQEAWEYTKFIRNPEADMAWIEQDFGALAVTHEALISKRAQQIPDLPLYQHELTIARPWPPHPQMIWIVRNVIAPYGLKAIAGEMDPRQAWNEAAEKAREALEEQ